MHTYRVCYEHLVSFLCSPIVPPSTTDSPTTSLLAQHFVDPPISIMSALQALPERLDSNATSFASLPEELVVEIAEHLANSYALASLASFNATCRSAHGATLSLLYRSMILVTRDPEGFAERERELVLDEEKPVPQGWKFVK